MLDTTKDLSVYKKEWFNKIEENSAKLFDIAENALETNKNIQKVLIVKRFPRYDRSSDDILQMKSKLSEFGNVSYDQLWKRKGSPENIQIVNIDLQTSSSKHLKYLIFGDPSMKNYDGIHLRGKGATRHFTYRTINTLRKVIHPEKYEEPEIRSPKSTYVKNDVSHTNCPQAMYQKWRKIENESAQKQFLKPPQTRLYSEVVDNRYSVPTKNRFNPLN